MRAEVGVAGRRLCSGTWLGIEAWGRWLSGASHKERSGIVRLGVITGRLLASLFAVVFYGSILQRAPQLIYVVPVAWLWTAWQVSDSSATPPPKERRPSCHKCAGQELLSVTPSESQKGMLIYSFALAKRPGHTHLHITKDVNDR